MTSTISNKKVRLEPNITKIFIESRPGVHLNRRLLQYINQIQIVHIKESALLSNQTEHDDILSSYIVLDNVRPELFLRRDFIEAFVKKGAIHLSKDKEALSSGDSSYRIHTINNELYIILNSNQYHRFGLIAERLLTTSNSNTTYYQIRIDLKNEKILKCNKFQDKLVKTFRRLDVIKKLNFRFVPNSQYNRSTKSTDPNDDALEFFEFIIDEYAKDGFKPVPLISCSKILQRVDKKWTNRSQVYPTFQMNCGSDVVSMVDWLGFQLLSLDCQREEIRFRYLTDDKPDKCDVVCTQISGHFDSNQILEIINKLISNECDSRDDDGATKLKAIFLHNSRSNIVIFKENFSSPDVMMVKFDNYNVRERRSLNRRKKKKTKVKKEAN